MLLRAVGEFELVAPGLQPADSGEFQFVARELGIAHPPGYPLYTLAAHGFGRFVTWEPVFGWIAADAVRTQADMRGPTTVWWRRDPWPWAVNLFSAVLALATLGFVVAGGRRACGWIGQGPVVARAGPLPPCCPTAPNGGAAVTPAPSLKTAGGGGVSREVGGYSVSPGLLAAAVLLATPTFQAQALVANIRMPTALAAAALFWLALRWLDREARGGAARDGGVDWGLVAIAFVYGLGAAHHSSLVFLGLPITAIALLRRPRVWRDLRTLAAMAAAFALSLLPLLYLPLRDRAGALFAPGNLTTAGGFLNHVLALGFRGDVLYFEDVGTLVDRLAVLWNILWLQFGWLLVLVAVGALWLAIRRPLAAFLLITSAAMIALLAVTYRAPQTMEYLLPAYVALAVLAGGTGGAVIEGMRRRGRDGRTVMAIGTAAIGAAAIAAMVFWQLLPRDDIGSDVWSALQCVPRDGTILASWHFYAPLLYAARHANAAGPWPSPARPDVTVAYVHPEGAEPIGETWRRRLAETAAVAAGQPVILTNRSREMIESDAALWPVPGSRFFASEPVGCPSAVGAPRVMDADFGGTVRLAEARLTPRPSPAGVDIDLAFTAIRPVTETLAVVAQLVGGDGTVRGQVDHAFGPSRWNDPRGLADRMTLVPFAGSRLDADVDVLVGVYRNAPAGPARLTVAGGDALALGRAPSAEPQPAAAGIPFGSAMQLIGQRVRRSGDELIVDLAWLAGQGASRSDYTVSVQAHGEGWSAQDDGTPALGAIPTLKWLPGMVIHDRHRVRLPAGLAADAPFRVTIGVYDAFSLEPLPVTDAERVRQGEGQAVEIGQGP